MPELIFMKLGAGIMALEPISTAYFINLSHQSVCLYVYSPIVARQRLAKNVTAATNKHAKIEELLDATFLSAVCVILKESRSLVPKTPYFFDQEDETFRT
jgi:hypothetical protein